MSEPNDSKSHYESLISLFKFSLGLFSFFGVAIGYLVYSDGKEMRQELKERKIELNKSVEDMKSDLKQKEQVMRQDLINLSSKIDNQVNSTKQDAITEITNIKTSASNEAKSEARNKINEVFSNKNFDEFVEKIAKERMEPQINNLVDKKLSSNQNILIETAVQNLSSSDRIKLMQGLSYLQLNSSLKLSDNQIKRVISAMEGENLSYRLNYIMILLFRNSEISTDFFKLELESGNSDTQPQAMQYFVYHNIDYNKFSDCLFTLMYKKKDPYIYFNAIEISRNQNKNYLLQLLNSKELVNLLYKYSVSEQANTIKNNIMENLKNNLKENEIKSTYLFSKN